MKVERIVVFLTVIVVHHSSAVIHTLKYFYSSSSGVSNFPEFVTVGVFDGEDISYYDSSSSSIQLRQEWMKMVAADDPHYLQNEARKAYRSQMSLRKEREKLMQRFNQTGGVHVLQRMYGCRWDNETNTTLDGYYQYAYDGEDFISFKLKEEIWVAAKQEAEITKRWWDQDRGVIEHWKTYLTHRCISWVKEYVEYRRSSLMRTELPSVSLLQKSPSSPVSCHATGFYPDAATLSWRKDEEELHEEVEQGEILPNPDGSFQMSSDLDLSSVPPEGWSSYNCVFQLSGGKEILTRLDRNQIRSNWEENPGGKGNDENPSHTVVFGTVETVLVLVAVLVVVSAVGFIIYIRKKGECTTAEGQPEVKEPLNSIRMDVVRPEQQPPSIHPSSSVVPS